MAEPADPVLGPATADVHLDYRPPGPTIREYHAGTAFMRVIIGPLGSAKTQSTMAEVWRRIHNQKPRVVTPGRPAQRISRWAVIRNTYADLQATTIKDWKEFFANLDERGAHSFSEGNQGKSPTATFRYRRSDGTEVRSEVMFLAYDRPEDQRKARGLQVTGIWFNEVKELNHTVVTQLLGRIGRFPARADLGDYWQGAVGDCNAPDADHWLGELALGKKTQQAVLGDDDYEWAFYIQPGAVRKKGNSWDINTSAENYHNLPRGYYQRQIAGAVNETWIRVNLGNEFILYVDGRPVHPDFNHILHTSEDIVAVPGRRLTVGIDFGRTPAAAIMQRQVSGNWFICDELVTTNTGALKFGRALHRFLNEHYSNFDIEFWGDPAGDDMAQTDDETPIEMLGLANIDCLPAPTNDFETRITSLDGLLTELIDGQPAVLIAKRCTTIIHGLAGGYQFARIATSQGDRYHDRPVKSPSSHAVEAVHYGLLGAGEGDRLYDQANNEQASIENEEDFEGWHPNWTGL